MPDKKLTDVTDNKVGKMSDSEIVKALNTALGMEHISVYCVNIKNEVHTVKVLDIIDLINRLQGENERLKKGWKADIQLTAEAKAEAYKECLGKVRRYIKSYCNPYGKPTLDYDTSIKIMNFIDNLLKELVGEKK